MALGCGSRPSKDSLSKSLTLVTLSLFYSQQVRDDIDIYDFERVLKTQEDDDDEDDLRKVRGSDVYRADIKSVEVDESTGGGLVIIPAWLTLYHKLSYIFRSHGHLQLSESLNHTKLILLYPFNCAAVLLSSVIGSTLHFICCRPYL